MICKDPEHFYHSEDFPSTGPKYAETWDFQASESSVVQFDIKVGCSGPAAASTVELQYSIDNGKTWRLVQELCSPPMVQCPSFHLASTYTAALHPAWTRVTTTLPKIAVYVIPPSPNVHTCRYLIYLINDNIIQVFRSLNYI